jgi:hypothetical protein
MPTCHGPLVVVRAQHIKIHFVGLHDLTVAQEQCIHLQWKERYKPECSTLLKYHNQYRGLYPPSIEGDFRSAIFFQHIFYPAYSKKYYNIIHLQ